MRALYASHNQILYHAHVQSLDDIAELTRGGPRIDALTSSDTNILFWFNTGDYRGPHQAEANRRATELLLTVTRFNGRDVPLLRGDIVLTGRDALGHPTDLDAHQIDLLTHAGMRWLNDIMLSRRLTHDRRRQMGQLKRAQKAHLAALISHAQPHRFR